MKKIKYICVNLIGVLLFFGLLFLHDSLVEYNNILEKIVLMFPFAFYLMAAIIDVMIYKQKTKFAVSARNFYFVVSGIVIIAGIITTIYWAITGKTGTISGTWISWTYNYIGNFLLYLLATAFCCVIGILAFLYVRLISYIALKLRED